MNSSASRVDRRGAAPGAESQYLTFFIAGEEYALGILRVREVIPYESLTRVPSMPAVIRGVTNLRGAVVPVVDLAIKFGLGETPLTGRTCIVIVELQREGMPAVMGIMTEAIGQVMTLTEGEIEPPPAFGTPIRTDFLLGMGKLGRRFALLLDLDLLMTAAELVQPAGLAEAAAELAAQPTESPEGDDTGASAAP